MSNVGYLLGLELALSLCWYVVWLMCWFGVLTCARHVDVDSEFGIVCGL
jgi:hypothetical protein